MATPATMKSGNANRRFVLMAVVLGLLGAVLVYLALSGDSGSGGEGGSAAATSAVVVANQEIPARTRIDASMLEVRLVPADTRSELAFSDVSQVEGQIARFPIAANEQVLATKVISSTSSTGVSRTLSYTVPAGMRAIAVQATQVMSAGGLVLPGDYVDILVVYDVQFGDETRDNYVVQTLMQNIEVLAVSQTVVDVVAESEPQDNGQRARLSEAAPQPEAVTVTVAVRPEDAQLLYLAESNGRLRLSVRPFGDGEVVPMDYLIEPDLFPDNLPNPFQE